LANFISIKVASPVELSVIVIKFTWCQKIEKEKQNLNKASE